MIHRALLAFLLVLVGCAARGPEPATVAWWIEDLIQGLPRRLDELRTTPPPPEELLVFLGGDRVGDHAQPAAPLRRRRDRLPDLHQALRTGDLRLMEGEVVPLPTLRGSRRRQIDALADAENTDRRQIDALVITLARLNEDGALAYRTAIRTARTTNDTAAGGQPWTPGQ